MVNIKRSKAPKAPFRYNDPTVVEQIRHDFFVLCYLCEEYVLRHYEIDHFHPQKYFPELENDWDNLFYCCEKCNKIRPKNINTTGNKVLNNCSDDVEQIELSYNSKTAKITIKSDDASEKTKNTIKLLHRIYNGIGSTSKDYILLRQEIKDELAEFKKDLKKYQKNKLFKDAVRQRLSPETRTRKSQFVSFKRQIIKDSAGLQSLEAFFD